MPCKALSLRNLDAESGMHFSVVLLSINYGNTTLVLRALPDYPFDPSCVR